MHATFPRPQVAPKARHVCPVCANARHVAIPQAALQIGPGRFVQGALPLRIVACETCKGEAQSESCGPFGALGARIVAFRPRTIDIAA